MGLSLDISREIVAQTLDVGGIVEDDEVELLQVQFLEILADALDEDARMIGEFLPVEEARQRVAGRSVRLRDEEGFVLVLGTDEGHDALGSAVAVEDLALAIDDVLLEIHRHEFRGAEILHRLGNLDLEFFGDGEESVNGVTGREHDGRVVENVDALRAELSERERLHEEERVEFKLDAEFFRDRLVLGHDPRHLLGNEYFLYCHSLY